MDYWLKYGRGSRPVCVVSNVGQFVSDVQLRQGKVLVKSEIIILSWVKSCHIFDVQEMGICIYAANSAYSVRVVHTIIRIAKSILFIV